MAYRYSLLRSIAIFCIILPYSYQWENSKTFFYNQTLDHFNFNPVSYSQFQQKYAMSTEHWGGGNVSAPIFVYLGAEERLKPFPSIMTDIAPNFRALVIFIEHRFYGDSIPFGLNMSEVIRNASIRGYFNSAQALADYAEVILYIKQELHALESPVVVFGCSYSGMLAAWLRLKYPHVAIGAFASSAPVLYFDDITPQDGYLSVVTKDFLETSVSCYKTIRDSWAEINRVAAQPNGISTLTSKFKICRKLKNVSELKNLLMDMYEEAAQYGLPPEYSTTRICTAIDGASNTNDILDRILVGLDAFYDNISCYNVDDVKQESDIGWGWQTCSEMAMPMGTGPNSTMFQSSPFNWSDFITTCETKYNVSPRPHWITTYYGGHDFKSVLKRFGSNIIFSNGLKDPYSSAGVLENISPTIVAIKTSQGSHCTDLYATNEATDPEWLVNQKKEEVKNIRKWIHWYYVDLNSGRMT